MSPSSRRAHELIENVRRNYAGRICEPMNGSVVLYGDSMTVLSELPGNSFHAIFTDPPYGLIEYEDRDLDKMKNGKGGVWRIPPTFDGANRMPLPRFTVLTTQERERLCEFFFQFASRAYRVLLPGGHLLMAANPLLSSRVFCAVERAGFEKRGEIIRMLQTLRGGDRPKGAESNFSDVSVMPRSCWEPWGLFRKPLEGTVANNLEVYGTGGLRRISGEEPFKDIIKCAPTNKRERMLADHPSLKPQRFLRQVVRAMLPLGEGIICDPFAGSGSTIAAAAALGYKAIGIERDAGFFHLAANAIPKLFAYSVKGDE